MKIVISNSYESDNNTDNNNTNNSIRCSFNKPCYITDEMANFINIERGSIISRTKVTKIIVKYIKEHNLANDRNINPDDKLSALLQLKDGEKLTYFNLQKYLKNHFIK